MKIELITVGKTEEDYLKIGFSAYIKRLTHYINFGITEISGLKNQMNSTKADVKEKEGSLILSKITPSDYVILLDEKGKQFTSLGFAGQIQNHMNSGKRKVIYVIGGAFGFSEEVYKRADNMLSLSQMTFSHQMVRLFFVEQLYRAMTILKGEKYHHE